MSNGSLVVNYRVKIKHSFLPLVYPNAVTLQHRFTESSCEALDGKFVLVCGPHSLRLSYPILLSETAAAISAMGGK